MVTNRSTQGYIPTTIKPQGQGHTPVKVKQEGQGQVFATPKIVRNAGAPGNVSCPDCGKQYSNMSNLNRHMQVHSGNYRYTCQVCLKGFMAKHHLDDHMKKHEGKAHVCEYCYKPFQSSSQFQKHLREHTGQYPFHCATCNQGFHLRAKLEAHENQHRGKGFTCLNCNKILYTEKEFEKHQQKCMVY